jgi:D-alanyl-D-alanine carboxypeptidase
VSLGVVALVAAAFLAGVIVGSAQAGEPSVSPIPPRAAPDPTRQPWIGLDLGPNQTAEANSPDASPSASPVPECRYADQRIAADPWAKWDSVVLDTALTLARRDVPPDLVDTGAAGINGGQLVRAIVVDDLRAMAKAARKARAPLAVQSAYRSYAAQVQTFNHWLAVGGRREALGHSARPGHSEHQLGTTIDFASAGGAAPWSGSDWARTRAGAWLMRHAWQYGFVLSYPRHARSETCYAYEPWHYRYVGRNVASAIHASGMTPREWLLGVRP